MTVSVEVKNERKVISALKRELHNRPDALRRGLRVVGFELGRWIIQHPIPRRDGVLARSLYVSDPLNISEPVVEVGLNTVYAEYQHEQHLHRYFVRDPYERMQTQFVTLLAAATKAQLNKVAVANSFPATPPAAKE